MHASDAANKPVALVLVLFSCSLGCSINPYTQRSQLVMTSPSYERMVGTAAYRKIVEDPTVTMTRDPLALLAVQRVAARLIHAAAVSRYADLARSFEWEITVIDDDAIQNAVAFPGGKIVVYTGLFSIARHEAGLAVALAHEMVHALARHSAEQITHDVLRRLRRKDTLLPLSQTHELEADYIGLLLTAEAGYDPMESVHLWERMKQSGDDCPPEDVSTHPSYETRISRLHGHLPEAWTRYRHNTTVVEGTTAPDISQAESTPEPLNNVQGLLQTSLSGCGWRKCHGIGAGAPWQQSYFAGSTEPIYFQKDLVPREGGTYTHQLF